MHGDALDLVLVALCVFYGYGGYRQGFLVGALSFVGIFGGGLLGTKLAVPIVHHLAGRSSAPLVGVLVVFAAASVGQVVAATVGVRLRGHVTFRPLRAVDDLAGAAFSVVAVLLVCWMLATAVAHSSLTWLAREARRSAVLGWVDDSVPSGLRDVVTSFRDLLDNTGFPAIVGPLAKEPSRSVPPPDPAVVNSSAVRRARASVVKIVGEARSCSRRIEGSGFVYGDGRVITNAHVVAGVSAPRVQVDGTERAARVVLYDPERDIAVLSVPGERAPALAFAGAAAAGADAVVAGYPEDGPFTAGAARVQDRFALRGPDIYQERTVTRDVYAVRADVRPGNSGGPLLATDGRVYGVVFAASTDRTDTGYVLTAGEVAPDAAAGLRATAPVGTGACD